MMTAPLLADCHVHILDPARVPYHPRAAIRPGAHETATEEQLLAVMDAHGVSHALIVTPTAGYAPDNTAMLRAVSRNRKRFRGVAAFGRRSDDFDLASLDAAMVSGVRFDIVDAGSDWFLDVAAALARRAASAGLMIDLQVDATSLERVERAVAALESDVVIDHCGRLDPTLGLRQPALQSLLRLAALERVHIKLSGPFRCSSAPFPYKDADALAIACFEAFGPDKCVWGSDWPFLRLAHRVDYGPCLAALERWAPDAEDRRRILWKTPARLFGFEPQDAEAGAP